MNQLFQVSRSCLDVYYKDWLGEGEGEKNNDAAKRWCLWIKLHVSL